MRANKQKEIAAEKRRTTTKKKCTSTKLDTIQCAFNSLMHFTRNDVGARLRMLTSGSITHFLSSLPVPTSFVRSDFLRTMRPQPQQHTIAFSLRKIQFFVIKISILYMIICSLFLWHHLHSSSAFVFCSSLSMSMRSDVYLVHWP